jgi:hypothetical protein
VYIYIFGRIPIYMYVSECALVAAAIYLARGAICEISFKWPGSAKYREREESMYFYLPRGTHVGTEILPDAFKPIGINKIYCYRFAKWL